MLCVMAGIGQRKDDIVRMSDKMSMYDFQVDPKSGRKFCFALAESTKTHQNTVCLFLPKTRNPFSQLATINHPLFKIPIISTPANPGTCPYSALLRQLELCRGTGEIGRLWRNGHLKGVSPHTPAHLRPTEMFITKQALGRDGVTKIVEKLKKFLVARFGRTHPLSPHTLRQALVTVGIQNSSLSDEGVASVTGHQNVKNLKYYHKQTDLERAQNAMAVNDARTGSLQSAAVVTPTAPASACPASPSTGSPFSQPFVPKVSPPAEWPTPERSEAPAAPFCSPFSLFGPTGPAMELGYGLAFGLCQGRASAPAAPQTMCTPPPQQTKTRHISFEEIRFESSNAKKPKIEEEEGKEDKVVQEGKQSPWQVWQKARCVAVSEDKGKNVHCICRGTVDCKKGPNLVCSSCTLEVHRACAKFTGVKKPQPTNWVCKKCQTVREAMEEM